MSPVHLIQLTHNNKFMKAPCTCCQPSSTKAEFCPIATPKQKKINNRKKSPKQEVTPEKEPLLANQTFVEAPEDSFDTVDAEEIKALNTRSVISDDSSAANLIKSVSQNNDAAAKHQLAAVHHIDNKQAGAITNCDLEERKTPSQRYDDTTANFEPPTTPHPDIEKSDFWTRLTLPTEFVKSGLDSYIFLSPTVANWTPGRHASINAKIGVGLFSACVGGGTAYCHFVLNYLNQSSRANSEAKQALPERWRHLIIAGLVAALAFDALGHGFEGTALTNGVFSQTQLPFDQELMLNTGLLIASILMSWADIRTCLTSISRLFNIEFPKPTKFESDFSPGIALAGRFYCVFFANLYFYGEWLDRLTGWNNAETPFNISWNSLYCAGGFVALLAAGTGYCQYLLNNASLNPDQQKTVPSTSAKLSALQSMALGANWVVGSGELAASLDFVVSKKLANPVCRMIGSGLGLTLGAITYYSSQRTFTQTMLNLNAIDDLKLVRQAEGSPV